MSAAAEQPPPQRQARCLRLAFPPASRCMRQYIECHSRCVEVMRSLRAVARPSYAQQHGILKKAQW